MNESTADGVNAGARCGKRVVLRPAKKSALRHPFLSLQGALALPPPSTTAYFQQLFVWRRFWVFPFPEFNLGSVTGSASCGNKVPLVSSPTTTPQLCDVHSGAEEGKGLRTMTFEHHLIFPDEPTIQSPATQQLPSPLKLISCRLHTPCFTVAEGGPHPLPHNSQARPFPIHDVLAQPPDKKGGLPGPYGNGLINQVALQSPGWLEKSMLVALRLGAGWAEC